jgi:hypothetical protein
MKLKIYINLGSATAVAFAFALSSCKKADTPDDEGRGDKTPPAGDAGEKTPPTTGGGDKTPEPTPPTPEPAGKSTADMINGYWGMDKAGMLAALKKEQGDTPEFALTSMMVEAIADKMVIQLDNGKATVHGPEGPEEESYKIKSSDDATGEFVVDMIEKDGTSEEGKGKVEGDKMTLLRDGDPPMVMLRISEEEFAKRAKAMANLDMEALMKKVMGSLIPPDAIPGGGAPAIPDAGAVPIPAPPAPTPPAPEPTPDAVPAP